MNRRALLLVIAACGDDRVPVAPDAAPAVPLEIVVDWSGAGRVLAPGGVDCTDRCLTAWPASSTIALAAAPHLPGAEFWGWDGDCTGTSTCWLTLDGAKQVTARFVGGGAWPQVVRSDAGTHQLDDIATAADGGLVVVASLEGPGQLAGATIEAGTHRVLAKLTREGSPLWVKPVTSTGLLGAVRVAIGADETIFVLTSVWSGAISFGGPTIEAGAGGDLVVAAFDGDGAYRWAKRIGDGGSAVDLVADVHGNAVLLGSFQGTQTLDALVVAGAPAEHRALAVVVTPAGRVTTAYAASSMQQPSASRMAPRADGGVIFHLTEARTVSCTPGSFGCPNGTRLDPVTVLRAFDAVGGTSWSATWPDDLGILAIAPSSGDQIAVLGWAIGPHDVQGHPIDSTAPQVFLARLAPSGGATSLVTKPWPTLLDARIATLPDGSTAVLGSFVDSIDVLAAPFAGEPGQFVARLASDGAVRWAAPVAAPTPALLGHLAVDRLGAMYVTGAFDTWISIGATRVDLAAGESGIVMHRLAPGAP